MMRPDDHQIIAPMAISTLSPVKPGQLDEEGTGWGWTNVALIPADTIALPSTCKMDRP